jgi:hypothetical protein
VLTSFCQTSADALINLIDPAIKTLQKLETVWQTVKDDLDGLNEKASTTGEIPGITMEKIKVKSMIKSWNTLATDGMSFSYSNVGCISRVVV